MSTNPHLIKVFDTAPNKTMQADEIANETANTGKVIAVVAR
jgi:hypothetical protein